MKKELQAGSWEGIQYTHKESFLFRFQQLVFFRHGNDPGSPQERLA